MNEQIHFYGKNRPKEGKKKLDLVISVACKPGISPTIDHAQTVGECNSPIGWGSPSRVLQELGSQSQLGCLCATIEPRVYLPPAQAQAHVTLSRARARADTYTHTHARTYVRRGGTCPHVRARRIAGVAPWRGLRTLRCAYVRKRKRTRGGKGAKGQRDDSLEERRETRPGTHASRDVDAVPRLYDGAYSHTRKTHRRTHGHTRSSTNRTLLRPVSRTSAQARRYTPTIRYRCYTLTFPTVTPRDFTEVPGEKVTRGGTDSRERGGDGRRRRPGCCDPGPRAARDSEVKHA